MILRIDGKLYDQRMVRLMEHSELLELMTINSRKYAGNANPDFTAEQLAEALSAGDFWLYEVVDR